MRYAQLSGTDFFVFVRGLVYFNIACTSRCAPVWHRSHLYARSYEEQIGIFDGWVYSNIIPCLLVHIVTVALCACKLHMRCNVFLQFAFLYVYIIFFLRLPPNNCISYSFSC